MIWVILYALNIHLFDINLHFKIVPREIPSVEMISNKNKKKKKKKKIKYEFLPCGSFELHNDIYHWFMS